MTESIPGSGGWVHAGRRQLSLARRWPGQTVYALLVRVLVRVRAMLVREIGVMLGLCGVMLCVLVLAARMMMVSHMVMMRRGVVMTGSRMVMRSGRMLVFLSHGFLRMFVVLSAERGGP